MSMSPAALEAYACDYLRARRNEAEHAALVALARHARPPSRSVFSSLSLSARHGVGPRTVLSAVRGKLTLVSSPAALVRWLTAGRPGLAPLRLPKK
jgi:hypothetical protein